MLAADALRYTAEWSMRLGVDWKLEVPLKTHKMHEFAADGTPEWTLEFSRWIERNSTEDSARDTRGPFAPSSPQRIRTTRAFRKLRAQAPQEFLALYDLTRLNPIQSVADLPRALSAIARRLNERAIVKGYPERYDQEVVAILCYSGLHKIAERWL